MKNFEQFGIIDGEKAAATGEIRIDGEVDVSTLEFLSHRAEREERKTEIEGRKTRKSEKNNEEVNASNRVKK